MNFELTRWLSPFFVRTLILALFLLSGFLSPICAKEVYIVASDSSTKTQQITADIQKRIPSAQLITSASGSTKSSKAIYLTIGPAALRTTLAQNQLDRMIVSVFTSSQVYQSILESVPTTQKKMVTAIYADPSPINQFRLITLLYKKPTHVAAMLSSKTNYLEKIILNAANKTGTNLTIEKLSDGENINQVLNKIATVPAILAAPDNNVFSQDNMRNILLTSYRRNQSVIGFSPSFVNAGALATTYSDIEDINVQLEELIMSLTSTEKFPEPQFPIYFKTVVNLNVARSLNMVIGDEVLKFSHQPERK